MTDKRVAASLRAFVLLAFASFASPAFAGSAPRDENAGPTPAAASLQAARRPAGPAVITDKNAVFSIPALSRPEYLVPTAEPTFGTILTRIAGDSGTATSPVSGTWGADARHGYSKRQPWNADQTLLMIDNKQGGSPTPLFLDGKTYQPLYGPPSGYSRYDYRWHPSVSHANEQINVTSAGTELMWFDIVRRTKTRSWTLPFAVDGIGQGEGNASQDGRFILLADTNRIFVVDMDPQPPHAPYPNKRIGPAHTITTCNVPDCEIDWVSISPSGKYGVVSYHGDYVQVFDVDPLTLELTPRPMPTSSPRCHGTAANGFIYDVGHSDMALNPFDGNEDVIIGQEHCGNRGDVLDGQNIGSVVMVRLRDGRLTSLTDGIDEAYAHHISTRNLQRPGWAYAGYYKEDGARFSDEVIAVRMDGSGAVERLSHKHSNWSGCYRCENHAVPSPDGMRVLFASNWAQDCGAGCSPANDIKGYVISQPAGQVSVDPPKPTGPGALPESTPFALHRSYPNPAGALAAVEFSLDGWEPAELELIDVTGRVVWRRDLVQGPGRHTVPIGPVPGTGRGVYWLRLRQGDRIAERKAIFNRN
jgi:hypothetical protein